ncbi:hypothetical protein Tco_0666574 [Tanacetum coccineum]
MAMAIPRNFADSLVMVNGICPLGDALDRGASCLVNGSALGLSPLGVALVDQYGVVEDDLWAQGTCECGMGLGTGEEGLWFSGIWCIASVGGGWVLVVVTAWELEAYW